VAKQLDASERHLVATEIGLGPGDSVLDENPAPPRKGAQQPPFSAHVYCGRTVGWIKMPLGTAVGLGPGHIVLVPMQLTPPKGAQQPPRFTQPAFVSSAAR